MIRPGRSPVRRSRILAVPAATALAGLLAACSTGGLPSSAPSSSAASPGPPATSSGAPVVPASPVTGVVIDIDSAAITDIRGFTLRLPGGATQAFRIGALENAIEFPPEHLPEHRASGEPVRVFFRADGGDLVVYRIEDAGG